MTEGGPGGPGAAQTVFQDPKNTAQLLAMHQANTPFLDMAEAVGVKLSDDYARLVAGLSDAQVKIIRDAMIQALQTGVQVMPYHCQLLGTNPAAVTVTAGGTAAAPLARIDPA